MRTRCLEMVLIAMYLGTTAPAFGQADDQPPAIIGDIQWFILRDELNGFIPPIARCADELGAVFEPFDPETQKANERDRLIAQFTIFDPDIDDDAPDADEDAEEFFVSVRAEWLPFAFYTSPEPPPIPEAENVFSEFIARIRRLDPPMLNQRQFCVALTIPQFNGRNQARLRGFIDYDVAWRIDILVANEMDPMDTQGGIDGRTEIIFAVKDPRLLGSNPPAFADAGPDQTVVVGGTVRLDGSRTFDGTNLGFDPNNPNVFEEDTITYTWEFVSGPAVVTPTYPDLDERPWLAEVSLTQIGTYVFRLLADDGNMAEPTSDTATITVVSTIVPNRQPVAVISGPAASIVVGDIIQLNGSASTDPDGDALTYRWLQTNEIGGAIDPAIFRDVFQPLGGLDTPLSSWQALKPGQYFFRLIVSDEDQSATATASVTVVATSGAVVGGASVSGNSASGDFAEESAAVNAPAAGCGAGAGGLLGLAAFGSWALRRR